MLSMKAPPPETFRSGRDFAAWLGLTPKDHSAGGRQRHGGITQAGDSVLRSTRIVGATALLRHKAHTLARLAAGTKVAEAGGGGLGQ
jgi:transposase